MSALSQAGFHWRDGDLCRRAPLDGALTLPAPQVHVRNNLGEAEAGAGVGAGQKGRRRGVARINIGELDEMVSQCIHLILSRANILTSLCTLSLSRELFPHI